MPPSESLSLSLDSCPCQTVPGSRYFYTQPVYGWLGWIALGLLGATPTPKKLLYFCSQCKKYLGYSQDLKLRKQH